MRITNDGLVLQDPFSPQPELFYGSDAVNGDAAPWVSKPIGSQYVRSTAGNTAWHVKVKDDGADNDWVYDAVMVETFALADFTGAAAIGTATFTGDIPIGAEVTRVDLRDITGFTGDTSATIQVGDDAGSPDVDRYTTGTPSVFTTAKMVDAGAVSGTAIHVAAVSPIVKITSGSAWSSVTAGSVTVAIWYNGVC